MMTNDYGIEREFADLIAGEPREPRPLNRYSATKLIGSIRQGVLAETEEPEQDVSDLFPAFLGTAVHYYMEHHLPGETELHLEAPFGDNVVSGIIDNYDPATGVITDYKVKRCSDDGWWEAAMQIKIYAWLLRKNGVVATMGRIVAIRRDWGKIRNAGQTPIETFEFRIGTSEIEEAESFIAERIKGFEEARAELPECTDDERWKQPDKWAVYAHKGDARAKKVFDSEAEAKACAGESMHVEHRKGRDPRCECYCPYRRVCARRLRISANHGVSLSGGKEGKDIG